MLEERETNCKIWLLGGNVNDLLNLTRRKAWNIFIHKIYILSITGDYLKIIHP